MGIGSRESELANHKIPIVINIPIKIHNARFSQTSGSGFGILVIDLKNSFCL